jgi:hypothetical protein
MVDEKIAVDVSCQTENWDDARMEKYNKMKLKLVNLVNVIIKTSFNV